ncbi:uncharacterized protein LOC128552089 [Mercenaria mercenaria]|uniref:uncharacterized protein LOC128552089 n=1 Tax=Mercenaria mercenaria TaxID=6596 RepID=UPI00234EA819|nr:uncharacterized protein LOC128552089 [Mercenaria mercenaria]
MPIKLQAKMFSYKLENVPVRTRGGTAQASVSNKPRPERSAGAVTPTVVANVEVLSAKTRVTLQERAHQFRIGMVTIENEYYLRTILLLCEGGAYIAKHIIGRELPKYGGDLDTLLKQFKNKLRHEFHEKKMEKLFPNNCSDKTDFNKWDIQMLIGVTLLLFRKSLSHDEKQKLKTIKFIRHEILAHSLSASICLEKYEDVRQDLRDAINTLAGGFDQTVKNKCKEYIKTYAFDPFEVKSAIKRLQDAKDTDDLFQEVTNIIIKSKETLSNEIHGVESIVRQDGRTNEKLTDKLNLVEVNVRQDVKTTTEKWTEEMEKIEGAECNSFQALTEVKCQIRSGFTFYDLSGLFYSIYFIVK